jgi:hypothetical protein
MKFNINRFIQYNIDIWTGFIIGRFCISLERTWLEYIFILITLFLLMILLELFRSNLTRISEEKF